MLSTPAIKPSKTPRRLFHSMRLAIACSLIAPTVIAAQEASERVEEVLVTSTFLPRRQDEIAGTVSVVGLEQIERQLIEDLNEVTRLQPGVTMDTAARGGNQGFAIRGIGGNRVLTVIDGIRSSDIYAAGPSSYGKDAFEMDDLRAVEIIRGPASVLYGADAMGGAIILRSKDPRDYLEEGQNSVLSVRNSASSVNDMLKTGVSYAFQNGDIGSVMQITMRDFKELESPNAVKLNPQDGESVALLWKSVWQASEAHTLHLIIDSWEEEIGTRIDSELNTSIQQSDGIDSTDRLRLSLKHSWTASLPFADQIETQLHWQRSEGEQRTQQLRTSYAFINPRNPQTFGGTQAQRYSDFEFNQDTSSAGLTLIKTFENETLQHAMVYGLSAERTNTARPRQRCDIQISSGDVACAIPSYPFASPEVFPNKTFPDTATTRTGIYWQDEISVGDSALRLIPGLRYDAYEMNPHTDALVNGGGDISNFGGYEIVAVKENHASFNFGALYDITPRTTAFVQVAEGYRPPNFDESNQAFVNLGHGYATVPNPELEAESSLGIEAGLRSEFARGNLSLALYHNDYDNFIESQMVGQANGISLFQDSNIGEVEIYGAELNASWRLSQTWQLRSAIAWSHGEDMISRAPLDSVSPLTAVISTRFDADSGRWGTQTLLTLAGNQDRVSAPDRVTGDAYALVDLVAYLNIGANTELRGGVFNLFDADYATWNSLKGLSAQDGENIAKAQAPSRHFRLSMNYTF